jgi:hypothetical protein
MTNMYNRSKMGITTNKYEVLISFYHKLVFFGESED